MKKKKSLGKKDTHLMFYQTKPALRDWAGSIVGVLDEPYLSLAHSAE